MSENDRGEFVRDPAGFEALAAPYFESAATQIVSGTGRIPGAYVLMTLSESRVPWRRRRRRREPRSLTRLTLLTRPLRLLASADPRNPRVRRGRGHAALPRNVGARDLLAYTAWLGWSATVPGILAWRAVDWRGRPAPGAEARDRHTGRLFQDVVLGTVLGVTLSIPAYLVAVALAPPLLVVGWPLLVLVPGVLTARGRSILLRRQAEPTPAWWSWTLAALMLYVVAFSAETQWLTRPLTPASLRSAVRRRALPPGPYHRAPTPLPGRSAVRRRHAAALPLVVLPVRSRGVLGQRGRTRRPAPPRAAGDAERAAAAGRSHGGIAPERASLGRARRLGRPLHRRHDGRAGVDPGQAPVGGLRGVAHLQLADPGAGEPLPPLRGPAGGLRGAARRPQHWVTVSVVMLAVAGSKSAMLPLFVAGLAGTALVMLVVRRRFPWRVAGLAALSVAVFAVATVVFYGSGSRAMTFSPYQIVDAHAALLFMADTEQVSETSVRVALSIVYVACAAATIVGGIGLFARGGWRRPVPWVLLGCWVAGVGALFLLRHPSFGQAYFYRSGAVPAAMLCGLGWARAVGHVTRRRAILVAGSLAVGLVWAYVVAAITSDHMPDGRQARPDLDQLMVSFGVPLGLSVGGVLLATVVLHEVGRATARSDSPRFGSPRPGEPLLVAVSLVLGMCLVATLAFLTTLAEDPTLPATRTTVIKPGGIEAARWLRDHSTPEDLVATNAHTVGPRGLAKDFRHFWMSGYSERRMLVEGWAYIPPESVGLSLRRDHQPQLRSAFWKPEMLRLNDEVFTRPTRSNITEAARQLRGGLALRRRAPPRPARPGPACDEAPGPEVLRRLRDRGLPSLAVSRVGTSYRGDDDRGPEGQVAASQQLLLPATQPAERPLECGWRRRQASPCRRGAVTRPRERAVAWPFAAASRPRRTGRPRRRRTCSRVRPSSPRASTAASSRGAGVAAVVTRSASSRSVHAHW